jgi:hypothetical protein
MVIGVSASEGTDVLPCQGIAYFNAARCAKGTKLAKVFIKIGMFLFAKGTKCAKILIVYLSLPFLKKILGELRSLGAPGGQKVLGELRSLGALGGIRS